MCLLLSFPLFIHNSLLPVPPYKRVNKRNFFLSKKFRAARDRMIHTPFNRPSLLMMVFFTHYFDSIYVSRSTFLSFQSIPGILDF